MRIRVRLHGHLHTYVESKSPEFELELPSETTVGELTRNLKIPDPEIWVVSLNGKNVPMATVLSNNDVLSIFPPVSGG
jgi:molybdopterin converting factor small subunit